MVATCDDYENRIVKYNNMISVLTSRPCAINGTCHDIPWNQEFKKRFTIGNVTYTTPSSITFRFTSQKRRLLKIVNLHNTLSNSDSVL
jgi:hypothetical protein